LYDTDKKVKDTGKQKMQLEAECRNYDNQDRKEMDENYNFKMTLDKGSTFGTLGLDRYERDEKLIKDLRAKKTEERDKCVLDREAAKTAYMGMADLQTLITEA